jgi:hypothetical protein
MGGDGKAISVFVGLVVRVSGRRWVASGSYGTDKREPSSKQ